MSYLKIWIHAVWATKNREPLLTTEVRRKLFDHIRENAKGKKIYLDHINGYTDHVHCLISLGADQTISKTIQLLKGESAYWVNKEKLTLSKFSWQSDYFAVSVSESMVEKVRNYISQQEDHHRRKTFSEEYEEFIEKFGFKRFNR